METDGLTPEFLRSLPTIVPLTIMRLDRDLVIRYINRLSADHKLDQVLGRSALDFVPPLHRDATRDTYERVFVTGESEKLEVAATGATADSNVLYEVTVARVSSGPGTHELCLVTHDVTEHVRRETDLRASQEKLRHALKASQMGLWSWDVKSDKVEWDERMHAITLCDEPLALPAWLETLAHPDDRELLEAGQSVMAEGRFPSGTHRIVRSDGSVRSILTNGELFFDAEGNLERILGGVLDVTEQRNLEEQLQQAQKMETVGNLAAGITHNFNNMLMVIQPCLEMIEGLLPEEHREWAQQAIQASNRAAEVVGQLMNISGQGRKHERAWFRIADVCREAVAICQRTFDRHIRLHLEVTSDAAVRCEAGDLEQVVMNILLNARDALIEMPAGATPAIWVKVSEGSVKGAQCEVLVEISDNGPGMSPTVRERIFDPFFSTKNGAGSGLGLSSSQTIVEGLGGKFYCESAPGQGARFTVRLPAVKHAELADASPENANEVRLRGNVLIVDDEEAICRIVTLLLRGHGMTARAVGSVAEGREHLKEHNDYDLVLLDRSMPGAPGRELLPDLRASMPQAKVLFFSGHDLSANERLLVDGWIHKPIHGGPLVKVIATALGGADTNV